MHNQRKSGENNKNYSSSKPKFEKDGKRSDAGIRNNDRNGERNHRREGGERSDKFPERAEKFEGRRRLDKNFPNKSHSEEKPRTNNPKVENHKFDTKKIKLNGTKTLCSFVILNAHTIENTLEILKSIALETIDNLVISVPQNELSELSEKISQLKIQIPTDIIPYSSNEFKAHNNAFQMHESDLFLVISSSVEPRSYAIEILKRYLSREHSVIVVPTVYNSNLEIQKYCLRFPTLVSQLKCLVGSKKTAKKLVMMERGESGYYKIHRTDASLSQAFILNSAIFKTVKMFPIYKDTKTAIFIFYKKLAKYGTTLFVPSSRFIEHKPLAQTTSIVSKIRYFLKNVF